MNWRIDREGYDREAAADNGNRFLIANGYLGVRGTLDGDGKDALAAVNLAGIYDQVGDGWREPLNAPNPLLTRVFADGQELRAETAATHRQGLDFRHGVMSRETRWPALTLESRRFADMADCHRIVSALTVTANRAAAVSLAAEIDTDLWEIYGPHYSSFAFSHEGDSVFCLARVQNSDKRVAVGRRCVLTGPAGTDRTGGLNQTELPQGFRYTVTLAPGESVTLTSVCSVYTSQDTDDPLGCVRELLRGETGFEVLYAAHAERWEEIWRYGAAEIEGDTEAETALNYSLYHLNAIAPRHRAGLSIPARGLSGQTYKGAIFWDSEMFMLDYFLYTQPEVARSMLQYRVDTLPGALAKAKEYGWQGAFYAWESQEGGYDACSDYNVTDVFTGRPVRTFFRDRQVHISAAVARAILLYTEISGDRGLLRDGGARTVIECARFYASLLLRYAGARQWEIHDVIGPDEYHERVNNNAYTNRMAGACFRWAWRAAELLRESDRAAYDALDRELGLEALLSDFAGFEWKLKQQTPDETGLIEQFDGYFALEDASIETVRSRLLDPKEYWGGANGVASHTRVIKQADTVAMLELFHGDYDRETLRRNWEFYEPRTEHGSSLSACMYALLACRFGEAERAYPFFLKSAQADLQGGGKQWAGLVYIGGTHPAAEGGAWKVAAEGFAGLDWEHGEPVLRPCLPKGWKTLQFYVMIRGRRCRVRVTPEAAELREA